MIKYATQLNLNLMVEIVNWNLVKYLFVKMNELEMEPVMEFVILKNLILIKGIVNSFVIKNLEVMEYVTENVIMKKIIEMRGIVYVI